MENIESIERFIEYGLNKEFSLRPLVKAIWGVNIFWVFGFIYGVVAGGIDCVYGTTMLLLGFISTVVIIVKRKDKTVFGMLSVLSITSMTSIVNFILLAEILCRIIKISLVLKLMVTALPIVLVLILYIITKRRIKTNAFKDSKSVDRTNIRLYAILGSTAGLSFAKIFLSKLQPESVIAITIIGIVFLSFIYCFGTINLLKVYYINKYNLEKYKHIEEADK